MRHKVKLPRLSEAVDNVLVIEWCCGPGDVVDVGDVLMNVETDKVEAEVPAPVAGTVHELLVEAGDEVETGTPICFIET